jgi:hypothetical protein
MAYAYTREEKARKKSSSVVRAPLNVQAVAEESSSV